MDRPHYRCSSEPDEISLTSTVLLVFVLAVSGAFFIMTMAYLLGEDHNTGTFFFPLLRAILTLNIRIVLHAPVADGAPALLWAVKQSTQGCAGMC